MENRIRYWACLAPVCSSRCQSLAAKRDKPQIYRLPSENSYHLKQLYLLHLGQADSSCSVVLIGTGERRTDSDKWRRDVGGSGDNDSFIDKSTRGYMYNRDNRLIPSSHVALVKQKKAGRWLSRRRKWRENRSMGKHSLILQLPLGLIICIQRQCAHE